MNDLNEIKKRLTRGYHKIIYPRKVPLDTGGTLDMGDVPVELEKMAIHAESGDITGYYSLNALSDALGKAFEPTAITDDRFAVVHWGFDEGQNEDGTTDKTATANLLKSHGLVDMREGIKEAKDIDFSNLPPHSFGIFGAYEFEKDVAKYIVK